MFYVKLSYIYKSWSNLGDSNVNTNTAVSYSLLPNAQSADKHSPVSTASGSVMQLQLSEAVSQVKLS